MKTDRICMKIDMDISDIHFTVSLPFPPLGGSLCSGCLVDAEGVLEQGL